MKITVIAPKHRAATGRRTEIVLPDDSVTIDDGRVVVVNAAAGARIEQAIVLAHGADAPSEELLFDLEACGQRFEDCRIVKRAPVWTFAFGGRAGADEPPA